MNLIVSVVVVVVFVLNLYMGWRFGLLRRLIPFAFFYGGTLLGGATTGTSFFGRDFGLDPLYWSGITVCGLGALGWTIGEIISYLYRDQIRRLLVVAGDRVLGFLAGGLIAFLECGTWIIVALAVGTASSGGGLLPPSRGAVITAVHSSPVAQPIASAGSFTRSVMRYALPRNLPALLGRVDG
ncbi:MAG TPA: hypothetical protein VMW49_03805 [Candidatus Dormibacteraeota bacterium]|nr:hypothetical protein [Candidatus Dormibacteraeota bacterium]